MKKGLLMTSALVAAGMLTLGDDAQAQQKPTNPVQLRLGGYVEELVGQAFNRLPATHNPSANGTVPAGEGGMTGTFDQQTESEIHVIGDGRLDNGLVIRAVFEFEVTGSPGNLYDEAYLVLRNGFGQLVLGAEDPVSELMTAGYGNGLVAHAGVDMTYGTQSWIPVPNSFSGSPTNSSARSAFIESPDNNDANKIIYVSPRFFGLQAGLSYAPESRNQLYDGGAAGGVDTNKRLPAHDLLFDIWSAGLNYEFGALGAKFGLATGYVMASKPNLHFTSGSGADADAAPARQWGIGARMDLGGLRAIVGYKKGSSLDNGPTGSISTAGVSPGLFGGLSSATGGNNSVSGYGVNAGVLYAFGPNAVSLNGRYGTERGTWFAGATTPDKISTVIASYARTLAPGIKWTANLLWQAYNDQPQTDRDFRGGAAVTTIRLDF